MSQVEVQLKNASQAKVYVCVCVGVHGCACVRTCVGVGVCVLQMEEPAWTPHWRFWLSPIQHNT